MSYAGKVVLITGGAKGIGYCLVKEFSKAGATVLVADVSRSDVGNPDVAASYYCDVSSIESVRALRGDIGRDFGRLDVLVNNAGVGHHGDLASTSLKEWKKLIDVNLWGTIYPTHELLMFLEASGGQVINVSSGQVFFQLPTWGAYTVSKIAQATFSEVLYFELAKKGIAVTTVYPFMVDTGFYDGVKGKTWAAKLSMTLLPFYSMKPETVAAAIFKAAKARKRVEMISPINTVGKLSRVIPGATKLVGMLTSRLLGGSK